LTSNVTQEDFKKNFHKFVKYPDNPFHPLVWINNGDAEIGENTAIGGFSDINGKGARLIIGSNCDIASFSSINVTDSHYQAIGLEEAASHKDIIIGDYVFIGSHCVILGGTKIGSHSVIGAGTIIRGETIPPYSFAVGNPVSIKPEYYKKLFIEKGLIKPDPID
jgi:acetyltransferase-like isoleucine patch superfamily enzyme